MTRFKTRVTLGIVISMLLGGFIFALPNAVQNEDDGAFTIGVDVELVQLPISVLDRNGRMVQGLQQQNFTVFEDNVRQEIRLFKQEDVPISLGLVIDNSASMRNKRARVNNAALSFVQESNREDETFIVNFDDEAYLEQDFTRSMGDLVDALSNIDTRGPTAMYDAVYLAVEHVQEWGRMDKKAILVISDGEDSASRWGLNALLNKVREAQDVTIYAVGLLEEGDERCRGLFGLGRCPSRQARNELTQIAELSGGQAFFPESLDEIEEICRRIAHDLRNQYLIGYSPSNRAMDGSLRTIRVEVNPSRNVTVHTKPGYYAPTADDR